MSKNKLDLSMNNIATCVFYAIVGLLLLIMKGGSLGIVMTVVGVLLIVLGILDISKQDQTKGLIETIVGVAIIVCGWLIADIVLLVLGILLIVKGAMEIFKNYKNGFMGIVSSIVTIVVGILLVVAKWTLLDVICIVAGIIFIINAVLALFGKKLTK